MISLYIYILCIYIYRKGYFGADGTSIESVEDEEGAILLNNLS